MKISHNITYAEAIHSETAKRKGIDNTPNPTQIEAMKLLAEKVFQPKLHSIVKVKQLILMMSMVIKLMQKCITG